MVGIGLDSMVCHLTWRTAGAKEGSNDGISNEIIKTCQEVACLLRLVEKGEWIHTVRIVHLIATIDDLRRGIFLKRS